MTDWSADFMVKTPELFPRRLNDVVADLVRRRWGRQAADTVHKRWRVDPKTGESVASGHLGIVAFEKGIRAEGWELLEAIGHAMTGQTYAEWQEARLKSIIEEATRAESNVRLIRARADELAALSHRQSLPDHGDDPGQRRGGDGGAGLTARGLR